MTMADKDKYIVLIVNWKDTGAHWVKGFDSLSAAQFAVKEKYAEKQDIESRVFIIKGEIKQLGLDESKE